MFERMTIERQLFSWQEWDEIDGGILSFENVKLKVPVGKFPAGTPFALAVFDSTESTVSFFPDSSSEYCHTYAVLCTVGEELNETETQ